MADDFRMEVRGLRAAVDDLAHRVAVKPACLLTAKRAQKNGDAR